ncbi:MAG: transcription elongation factor GreA [Spirochaetes bacterium]|nr:transcription elongation factor GreA [Spirochaetota bacterium]
MSNGIEDQREQLRKELDKLKYEFKIELPKKIAEARAYGDLRENAEYHAARERQSFVKARIGQLSEQMIKLSNIDLSKIRTDCVGFGSTLVVLDRDSGKEMEFSFVSPNEINPSEGKISLSSPIGQALNNRTAGEEVEVNIPAGKRKFLIQKIITIHGNIFENTDRE